MLSSDKIKRLITFNNQVHFGSINYTKFRIRNYVKIANQIVIYKRMFKHVNLNTNLINY